MASYRVHSQRAPEPEALRAALAEMLRSPLVAAAVPDIELVFDDVSSPWHTRCTAMGPDRPGLLFALTATFAAAGASVHSARITTENGEAVDHFELSDGHGTKLDDRAKERVLEIALPWRGQPPPPLRVGEKYMTRVRTKPALEGPAWTA